MTWSMSFHGIVLPVCGSQEGALEVHRETGRMLRQGSEARLCFDCGPDGGVYHPDQADMPAIVALAAELDPTFNRFEVHRHSPVASGQDAEHAHTDGSDVHRHADFGWAQFAVTTELRRQYLGGGPGEKQVFKPAPHGPQPPFIAPTDEERIFRVLGTSRYVHQDNGGRVSVGRVSDRHQDRDDQFSRRAHRASLDLFVIAIRRQAAGLDAVLIGPSAILLAANRMMTRFRLTPIYEIEGWTPTFGPLP